MNKRQEILEKLNRISQSDDAILTLATSLHTLNNLMEKENVEIKEIIRFIEKDPMMTAVVIKSVNSSHYGFVKKIESISQAVTLIGPAQLKNIFATGLLQKTFITKDSKRWKELWKHSLGVAIIAKILASKVAPQFKDIMFTAGLLHDIGSFILYFKLYDATKPVFDSLNNDPNKRLLLHEKEILGITHDEIGYLFARVWKFPEIVTNCIKYHHIESKSNKFRVPIAIIKIANSLSKALEFGKSENFYVEPISNKLWRHVQVCETNIPQLVRLIISEFKSLEKSL